MREAIGSAWIFSICLTFIILMTAYLAISVNYAKAFKIKNHIVSKIEENEGFNGNIEQSIEAYLTSEGYTAYDKCDDPIEVSDSTYGTKVATGWENPVCIGGDGTKCSACVYKLTIDSKANDEINAPRDYYKVVTFFRFDLPIVSYFMNFPVSGETRPIYDFSDY